MSGEPEKMRAQPEQAMRFVNGEHKIKRHKRG